MHELSGAWRGLYSYPALLDPVNFTALLRQCHDRIDGTTEEAAPVGTLTATLSGRLDGASLLFLKIYDRQDAGYDAVRYDGAVDPAGGEIWGRWTVPGAWSGTFLMIRAAATPAAMLERWAVRA